jgi:hypothetical protein
MNFFKWLFNSKNNNNKTEEFKEIKAVKKSPIFTIEHYPLTERYYPKYKSYYMCKEGSTGIISHKGEHMFPFALYSPTQEGAISIIERFKEQQLKNNINIINV